MHAPPPSLEPSSEEACFRLCMRLERGRKGAWHHISLPPSGKASPGQTYGAATGDIDRERPWNLEYFFQKHTEREGRKTNPTVGGEHCGLANDGSTRFKLEGQAPDPGVYVAWSSPSAPCLHQSLSQSPPTAGNRQ